jgi:hypothetical protein
VIFLSGRESVSISSFVHICIAVGDTIIKRVRVGIIMFKIINYTEKLEIY